MTRRLMASVALGFLALSLEAKSFRPPAPPSITGVCPQEVLSGLLGHMIVHGNGFTGASFSIDGTAPSALQVFSDQLAVLTTNISSGSHTVTAANSAGSSAAFDFIAQPLGSFNPGDLVACGPEVTNDLVSAGQVSASVQANIIMRYTHASQLVLKGDFTGAADEIGHGLTNFISAQPLTTISEDARSLVYGPLNTLILSVLARQETKKKCTTTVIGPKRVVAGSTIAPTFVVEFRSSMDGTFGFVSTSSSSRMSITSIETTARTQRVRVHPLLPSPISGTLINDVEWVRTTFKCTGEPEIILEHSFTILSNENRQYVATVTSQGPSRINKRSANFVQVIFTGNPHGSGVPAFSAPTQQNLTGTVNLLDMNFNPDDLTSNVLTVNVRANQTTTSSSSALGDAEIRTAYTANFVSGAGGFLSTALGRHRVTVYDNKFGETAIFTATGHCGFSSRGPVIVEAPLPDHPAVTFTIQLRPETSPEGMAGDWNVATSGGTVTGVTLEQPTFTHVTITSAVQDSDGNLNIGVNVAAGGTLTEGTPSGATGDIEVRASYKCNLGGGVFVDVIASHSFTIIHHQ